MSEDQAMRLLPCRVRPRLHGYRLPGRSEHDLRADQVQAIARVMRLFVADDLVNGVSPLETRPCAACGQERPAPGFVQYDARLLCNPCATAYEVQRARGTIRTIGGFLDQLRERHGA